LGDDGGDDEREDEVESDVVDVCRREKSYEGGR
jgi:hypothetical protein